ncbi:MAG: lipopolysaccharide transport periplasmic protein LptA [Gammaproteobacteria bacterium RIFCSPHIGHO2_12_FULL_43_28]|nr:MAG: lipopolysaccharide transport periplasmic protein LptA [Gammaproteobacteria bacterium RIFCSPHIGHO2_12_FULL_43_28]
MFLIHKRVLLLALLTTFSMSVLALDSDKSKPMHITSDNSSYNYKTGVRTFTGRVKVIQGTTHLTADKLVTKDDDTHKIRKAIAYGFNHEAHYWTLPKVSEALLHARALVIELYPGDSTIILKNKALIQQGKNSFKGEEIHYNRENQTITVPAKKNGRAVLVYNPD